jgi:hypothetical protein
MTACLARQYSDQMLCGLCGLAWDVNDPEPPECETVDHRLRSVKSAIAADKEIKEVSE